ncbi:hypothetical protein JOE51_007608 [Bradyrhizobium japonicum]|nr:hypothetical protein [Bradyrhizobium japonicum]
MSLISRSRKATNLSRSRWVISVRRASTINSPKAFSNSARVPIGFPVRMAARSMRAD